MKIGPSFSFYRKTKNYENRHINDFLFDQFNRLFNRMGYLVWKEV